MKRLAAFRSLGAIDARNVARDSMLRWMALFAPAFGLLFRFGVPPISEALGERLGFGLAVYYPLLMSFLPLVAAGMIGTVGGFLLLDERDDQMMPALLVTPLSLRDYLRYRLGSLTFLSAACGAVMVPLAGLTETTPLQVAVTALAAAPLAPVYALFLGTFAANKVQGFALAKAVGVVVIPVVISYFVTGPWQTAFGLVPHYWPVKVFWLFHEGAVGRALAHTVVGVTWQGALLVLLVQRFSHAVRQEG